MALIHGSQGLIYFVHQFKPTFREAALLDDPETLAAVTALNRQIHELAPVLNSPAIADAATVDSSSDKASIAWMVKLKGEPAVAVGVPLRTAPFSVRPGGKAPLNSEKPNPEPLPPLPAMATSTRPSTCPSSGPWSSPPRRP